jgi:hypothetical protein
MIEGLFIVLIKEMEVKWNNYYVHQLYSYDLKRMRYAYTAFSGMVNFPLASQ